MFTHPEAPSNQGSAEIGPPPYYHRSDCHICRKQDGLKTGSELLDAPRPGGYIVEDEHFLVEHAPLQESSAGTVIVEARRHLLDFGEMTPAESAELGSLLHRLVPAIKAATGVAARLLPGGDGATRPTSISGSCRRRTRESFEEWTTWPSAPSHVLVQRCRSDVAEDPSRVRAVLRTTMGFPAR